MICEAKFKIINGQKNLFKFDIIIVPADGLAPIGARPSAATVMTGVPCINATVTFWKS